MGLFGRSEAESVQVAGLALHCEICKHDRFWHRQAQLNTAVATFFNFEFPNNFFHLRKPVLEPLPGRLPEPEIHARLVEAIGLIKPSELDGLRHAADHERKTIR